MVHVRPRLRNQGRGIGPRLVGYLQLRGSGEIKLPKNYHNSDNPIPHLTIKKQ